MTQVLFVGKGKNSYTVNTHMAPIWHYMYDVVEHINI